MLIKPSKMVTFDRSDLPSQGCLRSVSFAWPRCQMRKEDLLEILDTLTEAMEVEVVSDVVIVYLRSC